jgi:pimeloyl-ACP methyl ester carboxylesterase
LNVTINNQIVNYEVNGTGKPVLLLHGWGCDVNIFKPISPYFESHFQTFRIDFPGFGKSPEPSKAWGNDDYVEFTRQFIVALEIENPIVLGHSFGGRIAIKLATLIPIHKLILTGSAGIKPTRGFTYYIKIYSYKSLKQIIKIPLLGKLFQPLQESYIQNVGSSDYQQASNVMRQTLSNVVNTDLQNIMPNIKIPTLLLFGENDTATPPEYGKIMNKLIPDSGLVIMQNAGHYTFIDQKQQFILIIDKFLEKDK